MKNESERCSLDSFFDGVDLFSFLFANILVNERNFRGD